MDVFGGFEHIVREHEPLAAYTWFRLGGGADYFAEPTSIQELVALVQRSTEQGIPVRLLGSGSNVLVRDEGFRGLVIRLSAADFCGIQVSDRTVSAGGGAKLGHVISTAVREGLAGLEELVGVPGTIGGALHGNASGQGTDIGEWISGAKVMLKSGEIIKRRKEEMRFSYRQSSLDDLVILQADFELEREDPQELTKRLQKLWILQKAHQPLANQNCGCMFKNPGGATAASLIDLAHLKSARVGDAELSDRNPNFVVTGQRATSRDVVQLMEEVRGAVAEKLGVELELQIEVW